MISSSALLTTLHSCHKGRREDNLEGEDAEGEVAKKEIWYMK